MLHLSLTMAIVTAVCGMAVTASANDPGDTVRIAEEILGEQMAIPVRQIPKRLLDEAKGLVIVPNVVKIGFIAGVRRGHGIIVIRDPEGEWGLPQFVTLTGGSVGWQAGIQGTDVVLVFTTRKGVEGLMNGKFTIGVDAAATAGPVGRDLAAGTDSTLQSEILSYSRSRGLFLGVALDGSALEIDHEAHNYFYGSPSTEMPRRVPNTATELQRYLHELSPGHGAQQLTNERPIPNERPVPNQPIRRLDVLRRLLVRNSQELQAVLSPEWRPYLAMPRELQDPLGHPTVEMIAAVRGKYAHLIKTGEYAQLVQRPEFEKTYETLCEYHDLLATTRPALQLPPPPLQQPERFSS